jgi:ATP-dependent DNA ligase
MLAALKDRLPEGPAWVYEPKWDGFRAIVWRDGADLSMISRDGKDLERYMPELVDPLLRALPERCVVDGEVIITDGNGTIDFDALLLRIHPASSRIEKLSKESPASFVAFDILALGDEDLRAVPFHTRRDTLSSHLNEIPGDPGVSLTPQTDDIATAESWIDELEKAGLDGVIAKRLDRPYLPGERDIVKVKRKRTVDCVVGGYRLSKSGDGVGSLLLGLYDGDGVLHYVGHTSSFRAAQRRELKEFLGPLEGGKSFGGGRSPGGPSRWSQGRATTWVSLEPKLVCEVVIDKLQGDRFRHAATFVRWRDDKSPRECTFDQIR